MQIKAISIDVLSEHLSDCLENTHYRPAMKSNDYYQPDDSAEMEAEVHLDNLTKLKLAETVTIYDTEPDNVIAEVDVCDDIYNYPETIIDQAFECLAA